jgi:mannose/fructose/N-acetylgalactosamine-specific phosphotransferase system component IIC
MNKVYNWSIVSALFFLAALGFVSVPYVALLLAGIGILAAYVAVVRYEDHIGFVGLFTDDGGRHV